MEDIFSGVTNSVTNAVRKLSDLLPTFSSASLFSSRKRPRSPTPEPTEPLANDQNTLRRDAFTRAQEGRINVLPSHLRTTSNFKRHRSSIGWTPSTATTGLATPASGRLGPTPSWRAIVPRTLRLSTESPYYSRTPAPSKTPTANGPSAPAAPASTAAAPTPAAASDAPATHRPPPLTQNAIAPRAAPARRHSFENETALTRLERLKSTKKYEVRSKARRGNTRANRLGSTRVVTPRTANGHAFRPNPVALRNRDNGIRKVQSARARRPAASGAINGIEREAGRILATNRESWPPSYLVAKASTPTSKNRAPAPVAPKRPRATRPTTVSPVRPARPAAQPKADGIRPEKPELTLPRPRDPVKSLDLEKLTDVPREKLCSLYTPEVVTLMETNPLFAEKILKMHKATMASDLRLPGKREERKKHIREAEEHLVKIRARTRMYMMQQDHENKLREAARAGAPNGNHDSRSEKPPSPDSEQFLIDYDVDGSGGVFEETPESLEEKEEARTVVDENSAFSELTPHAVKRVRSVLGASTYSDVGRTLYAKISGCTVHGSDLQTLKPNTWLNDEIVNSYLELLYRRNEIALKESVTNGTKAPPKVRFMSSFFYSRLFEMNRAQGCQVYDYTRVRRWTKKFDVFDLDMLVIPINQHNVHWTLGVVNFRDKRVEHYDSFGGSGSDDILENLLRWVADERENKKGDELDVDVWEKVPMTSKMPQQNNSDDCGVFVCKFADFITRGAEVTFEARHMKYFRARIAHEIMMQRVA